MRHRMEDGQREVERERETESERHATETKRERDWKTKLPHFKTEVKICQTAEFHHLGLIRGRVGRRLKKEEEGR